MEVERERIIETERKKEIETDPNACPECESIRLIMDYRRGETYCQDCGLVVNETYIDPGPEWSVYDSSHLKRKRTGPAVTNTLHDKGLSTEISFNNKDATGKRLSGDAKTLATRLRSIHKRQKISGSREKNLITSMMEIDRLVSALGLSTDIKERAAVIFRKAHEMKLTQRRHYDALAAASVYAAIKEAGLPRTLNEVVKLSPAKKRNIGKAYRLILKELNINTTPTDPKDLLTRYSFTLELDNETRKEAEKILDEVIKTNLLIGRDPRSLIAAAIYIASHLKGVPRTQKEIAKKIGVTEVTVRNRYKEIVNELDIDLVLHTGGM